MTRSTPYQTTAPDLIFLNARVLTLSPPRPRAEAVAIKRGVIVGVGSNSDVRALAGPRTSVIDCEGRCLLPGFHDAHIHLLACARRMLGVECGPAVAKDIAGIQQAVRRRADATPPGQWIRAGDYDEFSLAEKRHPTRWDLDAATGLHPVRLQHRSLHACVLNSFALGLAGIDRHTSPPPGARIDIDSNTGELTGLMFEMGDFLGRNVIPSVKDSELRATLRLVEDGLLSKGITAVQDASADNGPSEWSFFNELSTREDRRLRVTLMVGQAHLAEMLEMGLSHGSGDGWLRLGPAKLMLTEAAGSFSPAGAELFEQIWEAHRLGFPVAIHAVEESAVCLAVEGIAAALQRLPRRNHGHRLEHASIVPPPMIPRLSELGIAVATQPGFLFYNGRRYLSQVDEHLPAWLYAVKNLVEGGILVGAGSDAPVAPANPLASICAAVTRRSREGDAVGPGQAIPVEQALRLHTLAPAQLIARAEEIGSVEPGKLADLALLSADPTEVGAEEIKGIAVEMTIVGGRIAWERPSPWLNSGSSDHG